jgi:hypothetical protein
MFGLQPGCRIGGVSGMRMMARAPLGVTGGLFDILD